MSSDLGPTIHPERDAVDFDGPCDRPPGSHGSKMSQFPAPDFVLEKWHETQRPSVVKFESMNLAVKIGSEPDVRFDEAVTMHLARQILPVEHVPIPETYGWRVVGDIKLIYMALAPGCTLRHCWDSLSIEEKESISTQLGDVIVALRSVHQIHAAGFIGSINGGRVCDRFGRSALQAGPFQSIKSFHDWLQELALRSSDPEILAMDPYRATLPDNCAVRLTHADLTLGNIMVAGNPGSRHISAIIDWEQSGWYPEYWEYCKLHLGVEYSHEWISAGWADKLMHPYEDELFAFGEYWQWRMP